VESDIFGLEACN